MAKRLVLWSGAGAVVLGLAGFGLWLFSLPPTPPPRDAPSIAQEESDATLHGLRPPKRERPLIAVIGINDSTETTDYLVPYGIMRRANVADIEMLATQPGPVTLYPVLKVQPDRTIDEFDARHPDGADYVIVPAMSRDDDPAALAWLKAQSSKGATLISVCAGAKVLAAAGFLDDKRATTHWYYLKELLDRHARIRYVADRRWVVDRGIATTTGISASMPMMLTLIEAIAGADKARTVASDLGLEQWDARHDSSAFQFTRPFAATVLRNTLAFWNRDRLGIELRPGVDEVTLAIVADAWSRTYRSHATTFSATDNVVATRNGIRILVDRVAATWPADQRIPAIGQSRPAAALDETLGAIAKRYGASTANIVAMQLEYRTARTTPQREVY